MTFALGRLGASYGKLGAGNGRRNSGPYITLSASTIPEDAALNDVIGTLSVANLGILTVSSYAITADPDDVFDLDGADLIVDGALDYETATSHSVTIEATLSDASTVSRQFTITVTDVSEGAFGGAGQFYQLLFSA